MIWYKSDLNVLNMRMKDKISWQRRKEKRQEKKVISNYKTMGASTLRFYPCSLEACNTPWRVLYKLFRECVRVAFMYSHCKCMRVRTCLFVIHAGITYPLYSTLFSLRELRITHWRIEKGEKHAKWNRHSLVHSQETEPTKRKIRKSYRWIF